MGHDQAPVSPAVLRPGAAGSEVSVAPAGHLACPGVEEAQKMRNACSSTSCLTVVLNPLLTGMV